MGFNVNNCEHLKLLFGRSSQIGAYNVLFMMRHEFIIKSLTELSCFSLRMRNIRDIFAENPQFERPLQLKVISNYARQIYYPLKKHKNNIVQKFNERKDFEQVITSNSFNNTGIKENLQKIIFEDKSQQEIVKIEQASIE